MKDTRCQPDSQKPNHEWAEILYCDRRSRTNHTRTLELKSTDGHKVTASARTKVPPRIDKGGGKENRHVTNVDIVIPLVTVALCACPLFTIVEFTMSWYFKGVTSAYKSQH